MKARTLRSSQMMSVDPGSDNTPRVRLVGGPSAMASSTVQSSVISKNSSDQQVPAKLSVLSNILKPMTTRKLLKKASTSTVGLSEVDRKRRIINNIPILSQAVHEYSVSEQALIDALQINTYMDKEVIFHQGHMGRDIFFIEEGHVNIVQKKYATLSVGDTRSVFQQLPTATLDSEVHIRTYKGGDYFGEVALLQGTSRNSSAVAEGKVSCMILREDAYRTLLAPVHQLLLYRYSLRVHSVLEKLRIFKELTPLQLQYLIDHSFLERFGNGEYLCRQGELEDRYFIVADGEAIVTFNELGVRQSGQSDWITSDGDSHSRDDVNGHKNGSIVRDRQGSETHQQSATERKQHEAQNAINCIVTSDIDSTIRSLGHKKVFESFGEMGLLGKPRSANVIACGPVLCLVLTRKAYQEALASGNNGLDADAEALLASSLIEEWNLTKAAMNLHISNPRVAHYLVMFIRKFKESYNQKFVGKTTYMQLFRRIHQEPELLTGLSFVNDRIDWESPTSSLSIIRSETQRILSSPQSGRTFEELTFLGRLLEMTNLLNKFEVPPMIHRFRVAQYLGRVMTFCTIEKDVYLFHQGNEECKAFVILRGKINIVNEDTPTVNSPAIDRNSSGVMHQEVLATLLAGESFGELALITVMKRSASAIAAADADLLVIDRKGLNQLTNALPGVTIRHMMAKRAEFLSQLNCFKHCDVSKRIRIAHDMQENTYEPRYVFFQDPGQQKTICFVKSGEVSVYLKKPRSFFNKSDSATTLTPTRFQQQHILVKVATIGAHEFFDASELKDTAGLWTSTRTMRSELSDSVYMCDTRVQVLELNEKGWRRLDLTTLRSMHAALSERTRWHHQVLLQAQTNQRELLCFQVDKPWMAIGRSVGNSLPNGQPSHLQVGSYHSSALAVQLKAREATNMEYAQYFPHLQNERQKLLDRKPAPAADTAITLRSPETTAPCCGTPSTTVLSMASSPMIPTMPQRPISPSSAIKKRIGGRKGYALGGSFFGAMEEHIRNKLVSPMERSPNAACWMNFSVPPHCTPTSH